MAREVTVLRSCGTSRDQRGSPTLVNVGILREGDVLTGKVGKARTTTGEVSGDYGILINGIRYESPEEAARAVTSDDASDGWSFWAADTKYGSGTLAALLSLDPVTG